MANSKLTQLQAKTLIQQYIEDPNAVHWSDSGTPSNLELACDLAYDELWGEILEIDPWLLSLTETITSLTSPGYIDLDSDLTNRFYRLQQLVRDDQPYSKADPKDVTFDVGQSELIVAKNYRYWFVGDYLYLSPLSTTEDVDITYSFYPDRFSGLADGTAITWPEGHESAFIYNMAIRLMAKGGQEDSGQMLPYLADQAWKRLLSAVKRRAVGPLVVRAHDQPQDWGSD